VPSVAGLGSEGGASERREIQPAAQCGKKGTLASGEAACGEGSRC
jgi:hypothetical protein